MDQPQKILTYSVTKRGEISKNVSEEAMEAMGGLGIVLAILMVVLAILWICLPFAVFGMKKRLDRIIFLLEQQNRDARNKETNL